MKRLGSSVKATSLGRRFGITLLEVVVVIAVLAVLATLILPAVQSARKRADGCNVRRTCGNLAPGSRGMKACVTTTRFAIRTRNHITWHGANSSNSSPTLTRATSTTTSTSTRPSTTSGIPHALYIHENNPTLLTPLPLLLCPER